MRNFAEFTREHLSRNLFFFDQFKGAEATCVEITTETKNALD